MLGDPVGCGLPGDGGRDPGGWDAASGKAQQRVHMVQGQAPEVSLVGQTATPGAGEY